MQSLVQQKVVRVQTNMRLQGMKAVGEVLKLGEIFVFFHCFFAHDNIVSSSQEL